MVEYEDLDLESTHSYAYDCFGRRIRKTTGFGATTRYINGGPPPMNWQVLEERDGSGTGTNAGAVKATYVYGNYIDEPISMRRDVAAPSGTPEDYFFFADDLFNVTCLTDASGTVVERYRYGDYGLPTILTAPLSGTATELYESAFGNTRLWNGREFDREVSFYYYRTRYLEPTWGRFTVRDRAGVWSDAHTSGNGLVLVASNPHTLVDPFGNYVRGTQADAAFFELTGSWTFPSDPGFLSLGATPQGSLTFMGNCRTRETATFLSVGVSYGLAVNGGGGGLTGSIGFIYDMPSISSFSGWTAYGTAGGTLPRSLLTPLVNFVSFLAGTPLTSTQIGGSLAAADNYFTSLGLPTTGASASAFVGLGLPGITYRGWEVGITRGSSSGAFIGVGASYAFMLGRPGRMNDFMYTNLCMSCERPGGDSFESTITNVYTILSGWAKTQRSEIEMQFLYTPLGAYFYDPFDDDRF